MKATGHGTEAAHGYIYSVFVFVCGYTFVFMRVLPYLCRVGILGERD